MLVVHIRARKDDTSRRVPRFANPTSPTSSVSPLFEALRQRIAVRYHLRPFDLEETAAYIKHHLRVGDAQTQIFSDGFVSGVHDHTKGVARKINNLCRSALLLGATEHRQILDETEKEAPKGLFFRLVPPIQSGQPPLKQSGL